MHDSSIFLGKTTAESQEYYLLYCISEVLLQKLFSTPEMPKLSPQNPKIFQGLNFKNVKKK